MANNRKEVGMRVIAPYRKSPQVGQYNLRVHEFLESSRYQIWKSDTQYFDNEVDKKFFSRLGGVALIYDLSNFLE